MGQIDRRRRRGGCAGNLHYKICTTALDNGRLIDAWPTELLGQPSYSWTGCYGRNMLADRRR
jgi:hypothetical protein